MEFLNQYWNFLFKNKKKVDYILPLLDVSNTIDNDSFYASLATAMYASKISKLENSIVAIDKLPTWISIPNNMSFYEQICYIMENIYNFQNHKCNYQKAIQLIIHTLKETHVTNHFVQNMKLLFLTSSSHVINEKEVETLFIDNGFSTYSKLIYWNFSQEEILNLPCEIHSDHSFLFSGYSLAPFYQIYNQSLSNNTTFSFVRKVLNNKRYQSLTQFLLESF
jgi:hypothetical protein